MKPIFVLHKDHLLRNSSSLQTYVLSYIAEIAKMEHERALTFICRLAYIHLCSVSTRCQLAPRDGPWYGRRTHWGHLAVEGLATKIKALGVWGCG